MDCGPPGSSVPSLSPRVCSDSCPLSQWCCWTTSSSATPFSFCLRSHQRYHHLKCFQEAEETGGKHKCVWNCVPPLRGRRFGPQPCWQTHKWLQRWQLGLAFCAVYSGNVESCVTVDEIQCSPHCHLLQMELVSVKHVQWQAQRDWDSTSHPTELCHYSQLETIHVCYSDHFSFRLQSGFADQQK